MPMILSGKNGNYHLNIEKSNVLRPNGRFSLVFKGENEKSKKNVIIKQLHPRLEKSDLEIKRFTDEFINCPLLNFIPENFEFIQQDGHYYIIREYFEGMDFKNFINRQGKKINNLKQKLEIFILLIEKVRLLHKSGFIHADLKPSNFIINKTISEEYEVKLIDLGLAINIQNSKSPVRNEKSPIPFSFHYSAPELMLNFPELIGESGDVFSLGMILYEWINGELPWENQHPAALTNLQLSQPLPSTRKIKNELFRIIGKSTAKYNFQQPPNRYETMIQKLYLQEAIEKRHKSVDEFLNEIKNYKEILTDKKRWWIF